MRWTKGRHAFIVTTHTDRQHIHCHIYYNSTTLDCTRKFRNFWGSSFALRRLSDRLCLENGLSIVENPKPRSKGKYRNYGEWQKERKGPLSYQDRLRLAIDTALAERPADLDEFLNLMKRAGYEVKKVRGGGISFRLTGQGQERFSPELFEAAQHIRTSRANSAEQERHIPLNTRGNSLLAGNVYCGHCGSRLTLTTNGKAYPCKDDPNRVVKRVRYICYGKTRKQTDCNGQTGYTAHILDGIIDKLVRQIFERMKAIPKSEIVSARYQEKMEQRKSLLHSVRSEYVKAAADLETLKGEVIKTIRGESSFSKELLNSLIAEAEAKCRELQENLEAAQAAYDEGQAVMASLNTQYNDIISWAEMYDTASIEAKKMIVSCLIKRVEVYRDYKLHIDFNIDFTQFCEGLDIVTIAA